MFRGYAVKDMELNKLSYYIHEEERENSLQSILWFELLFDGVSIENLIGDDKAIPYYYFEDEDFDLPTFFDYQGKKYHIIGVCICGDAGCGSTDCEIIKDENFVKLKIIFRGGYKPPTDFMFMFSRKNYDDVIFEIREKSKEYKKKRENKLSK